MKRRDKIAMHFAMGFLPAVLSFATKRPMNGWEWFIMGTYCLYQGAQAVMSLHATLPERAAPLSATGSTLNLKPLSSGVTPGPVSPTTNSTGPLRPTAPK